MTTFKEINLQGGTRLQMGLQHGHIDLIYYTEFIGFVDGEFLIVKTPFENGHYVQIPISERVTLRILSGVDIFTMNCMVKAIFGSPYNYMHLSYPTDIISITLRNAIRAKVNLPVQVQGIAEAGVIIDISVTGARIITDKVLGELNERALISFELPMKPTNQHAHIDASITIRSIQQLPCKTNDSPPRFSHGLSFDDLDPTNQIIILNLVYESMNRIS